MDAARESDPAGPAVAGSWIDVGARLEREYQRALHQALGAEEGRLRAELARIDERLLALDAEMHLALARDREDRACAAIRRVIRERRRSRGVERAMQRVRAERARLAALILRRGGATGAAVPSL